MPRLPSPKPPQSVPVTIHPTANGDLYEGVGAFQAKHIEAVDTL